MVRHPRPATSTWCCPLVDVIPPVCRGFPSPILAEVESFLLNTKTRLLSLVAEIILPFHPTLRLIDFDQGGDFSLGIRLLCRRVSTSPVDSSTTIALICCVIFVVNNWRKFSTVTHAVVVTACHHSVLAATRGRQKFSAHLSKNHRGVVDLGIPFPAV